MIPAEHALRASLALKLWSIERKRHVMALVNDEGLALFSGLNATPKKSYLAEYSSGVDSRRTGQILSAWYAATSGGDPGETIRPGLIPQSLRPQAIPIDVEYGSRIAGDRSKLSIRFRDRHLTYDAPGCNNEHRVGPCVPWA